VQSIGPANNNLADKGAHANCLLDWCGSDIFFVLELVLLLESTHMRFHPHLLKWSTAMQFEWEKNSPAANFAFLASQPTLPCAG
jgi:hypothetical protein